MIFLAEVLPDGQFEVSAGETTLVSAKQLVTFLAIEVGVDRFQRPFMVENDKIIEQSLAIKGGSHIMQICKQVMWVA